MWITINGRIYTYLSRTGWVIVPDVLGAWENGRIEG